MLTFILITLLVLALLKAPHERVCPLLFATAALSHDIYLSQLDGFLYYGSAAILDGLVLSALATLKQSALSRKIQIICAMSISLNAFGWILWVLYAPPVAYNSAFMCLYIFACFIIGGRRADGGSVSINPGVIFLRHNSNTCTFDAHYN